MDKSEHRTIVRFLTLNDYSANEIHKRMVEVYNESAPEFLTVRKWMAEFKRGCSSVEDDDPPERVPKIEDTEE
uniref:Mos1 transposase HTH domain-containing protein n=1 Tax=Glossina morsitans morsitans TaxID=37546 RepID=A0A1B0FNK3_GLOMM